MPSKPRARRSLLTKAAINQQHSKAVLRTDFVGAPISQAPVFVWFSYGESPLIARKVQCRRRTNVWHISAFSSDWLGTNS